MTSPTRIAAVLAVLLVAACTATTGPSGSGTPGPSATPAPDGSGTPDPSPTPGQDELSEADLKFLMVNRFGPLWFCDPDSYPVAVGDEQQLARERLGEIQADRETYAAILRALDLDPDVVPSDAQTLAIYRQWKMLNALLLEPRAGGFRFDAIFGELAAESGTRVIGEIRADGEIGVVEQTASGPPNCPICLARGTRIATPGGAVRVEDLRVGMRVWTMDANGRRIAALVRRIGSAAVPNTHRVVRLTFTDGRVVSVSPGHPLLDGRLVGELLPGDRLSGGVVASASLVAYGAPRTFDLLPSGATGAYWANGVLLGSTLAR